MEKIDRMVELAREIGHQLSLGMTLYFVSIVRQERGELAAVVEAARDTAALAEEHGFAFLTLINGVLLRPLGNGVYFMPPYVITPEEIALMGEVAIEGIDLATKRD